MLVYPDACIIIYWVENHPRHFSRIDAGFTVPGIHLAYTQLTRIECRTKPLREGQTDLLALYDALFDDYGMHGIVLNRAVCDRATELRARHGLKTPDALHLAAALDAGCDEFWTNDNRLEKAAAGRIALVTFD